MYKPFEFSRPFVYAFSVRACCLEEEDRNRVEGAAAMFLLIGPSVFPSCADILYTSFALVVTVILHARCPLFILVLEMR